MKTRQKAAGIHLLISLIIAIIIGIIFRFAYFPGYYFSAFDGWHRFFLIVGVDVILGPLLTLIIFNTKKPRKELLKDISVVALLQIAALGYGLFVFHSTRPVYTVFDGKIITFTSANEYVPFLLENGADGYKTLPQFGPKEVYAREAVTEDEKTKAPFIVFSPMLYGPITETNRKEMWEKAEALDTLNPALTAEQLQNIKELASSMGTDLKNFKALPGNGATTVSPILWVIISPEGKILSIQPIDDIE